MRVHTIYHTTDYRFQALFPKHVLFAISIEATLFQNICYLIRSCFRILYLLLQFQLYENNAVQMYKLFAPSIVEITLQNKNGNM